MTGGLGGMAHPTQPYFPLPCHFAFAPPPCHSKLRQNGGGRMEHRVDLDVIGVLEGSERSSSYRAAADTLRHYETLFAPYRQAPINVFEIGARRGAGLRVWQWYFSRAVIVCIDPDAASAAYASDRVRVEIGPRNDRALIERICAECPPTLVIDSGGPHAAAVIGTFKLLFPRVQENGLYVVEGLEPRGAPGAPQELAAFFLDLAQAGTARRPGGKPQGQIRDADEISFLGSAVAIRKRAEKRDLSRALATADAYLTAQRRDAGALERLAAYVLRHGGALSRAEAAIDTAIEGEGLDLPKLLMKAEIMIAQARPKEVAEALARAAAWPDATAPLKHRLARLQAAAGDRAGARASAEEAVRLDPANAAFRKMLDNLAGAS